MTAHKIEVVEVGPSGHTTIEVECRDRAHRDEMMARIREAIGGEPDLRAKVEALLDEEMESADPTKTTGPRRMEAADRVRRLRAILA